MYFPQRHPAFGVPIMMMMGPRNNDTSPNKSAAASPYRRRRSSSHRKSNGHRRGGGGVRNLDAHHVLNGLWVGSDRAAKATAELQNVSITHILNCAREIQPSPTQLERFSYFHLPLDDASSENLMIPALGQAHEFIRQAISQGRGVLIHCAMGISRSVAVAASFLILQWGLTPDDALRRITQARRVANPNSGFRQQLGFIYQTMINSKSPTFQSPQQQFQSSPQQKVSAAPASRVTVPPNKMVRSSADGYPSQYSGRNTDHWRVVSPYNNTNLHINPWMTSGAPLRTLFPVAMV